MDAVVSEIKQRRADIETFEAIYVNKIKFEDVLRQIEKDGANVNKDQNLTPSTYKQRPTYINSLFSYFN